MQLLWHRRDCRVADNPMTVVAEDDEAVLPVFVVDPAITDHAAPPRAAVLRDALRSLDAAYRDRGAALHVVHGDPVDAVPELVERYGADGVVWNRDYSGAAQQRDAAVRGALPDGVDVATPDGHVMHPPEAIETNAGTPYQVFTYYHRKWSELATPAPVTAPELDVVDDAGAGVPSIADLGAGSPEAAPPDGDRAAALDRLAAFVDDGLLRYDEVRDRPDRDGTSRLSHHLRFGTLGVRELWAATGEARRDAGEDGREAIDAYRRQLAWRDFYAQVLYHHPGNTAQNHHDEQYPEGIDWRNDEDEFAAWKRGETGYPIVDAGMRQLREEAWMHNRVRMIVASFLTKDLLIDWRWGYDWFKQRLADHDPANESGGWQWAAGTGTDAQPYFRVFNPASQCSDHDPEGRYVRRYVPELADAATEAIHTWPSLSVERREEEGPDYVAPIVDHGDRRETAIATYERARPDD